MENHNTEDTQEISNDNTDNIEESVDTANSKRHIDWGITTAIIFGAFFMIISFLTSITVFSIFIPFFIIFVSSLILFIAGVQLWRLNRQFGFELDSNKFRSKYYMMIASLILYMIGVLLMIFLYHNDIIIEITYVLVFPILLVTISHFNLFFEASISSDSNEEENINLKPVIETENKFERYKISYILPLIFSIIGSVIIIILPWYSISAKGFLEESYLKCYPNCSESQFTVLYTNFYNFQNAGLSRFAVYFVMLLIIVSGVIIYMSYSKKSSNYLRIGMLLSTAASFISIMGILTLFNYFIWLTSNSYPQVSYYSLESGFIIGLLLFFFSTAIAINTRSTMKKLVGDQ